MNGDLELMGESLRVSLESLPTENQEAVEYWSQWVREALATGLGLLSVHSDTSREFTLEEAETAGQGHLIEASVEEIMAIQRQHA